MRNKVSETKMVHEAKNEEHLRIGELAAELGLNPKTVRYYEEIGLLPQPERTASSYRLYDEEDRERLGFILKAKAIGLTLSEIREILVLRDAGEKPCEHVISLLDQKVAKVDEQLRALAEFRQELLALRQEAADHITADACVCGIIEHHEPSRPGQSKQVTAPLHFVKGDHTWTK
jgi:MerR family Zn(II)-responsive transcriptional regulator of zntA